MERLSRYVSVCVSGKKVYREMYVILYWRRNKRAHFLLF
jgi:hypothetical protein